MGSFCQPKFIIMKNLYASRFYLISKKVFFSFLFILSLSSLNGQQSLEFELITTYKVNVSNVPNTICNTSSAVGQNFFGAILNLPFYVSIGNIRNNLNGNLSTYHRATAGKVSTVYVDLPALGWIPALNGELNYAIGDLETGFVEYLKAPQVGGAPSGKIRYAIPAEFPRGTREGYLCFGVADKSGNFDYAFYATIPFVVEGPTNPGAQVPAIDTIVDPQIPYLVLHAPPGDASSSTFQESKTTCRKFQTSYAEDGSHSANLAVKIGVAGSAGIFVTTDFEFSVTVSAGLQVGDMQVVTSDEQTCITVKEGFSTGALTDPDGGGDVFIGYGTDLALGLYEILEIDGGTCSTKLDTGLIYAPVGNPRNFIYTRKAIEKDIADLELIVGDSLNKTSRQVNNALNQIEVWNKILAVNEANRTNPDNEFLASTSFSGGLTYDNETAIQVVETNTIEYKHYLNFNAGITTVVEVGGSGFTGGYEYKGSKTFGETQNASADNSKLIKYVLGDDDPDDIFNLKVVRDPMYGTPVFQVEPGTESSCPYQGGYALDQPNLNHDGTNDDHILLENVPIGDAASFKVDLCNESNQARNYYVKLNAESNLNGAKVSAAGVPLNGNDFGQFFTIGPNTCVQDLLIEVSRQSTNSPLGYPNLELFLYSACEESIQSSVFASVYFEGATAVSTPDGGLTKVEAFPNPAREAVYLNFHLQEAGNVQISVADLMGRRHIAYPNEYLPGGLTQKHLDLKALPTGLYYLHIQTATGSVAKKIQVVR